MSAVLREMTHAKARQQKQELQKQDLHKKSASMDVDEKRPGSASGRPAKISTPPSTPPCEEDAKSAASEDGKKVTLLSSYPVVDSMTPRARRRHRMQEIADKKKQENEARRQAAAQKRARVEQQKENTSSSVENRRNLRRTTTFGSSASTSSGSGSKVRKQTRTMAVPASRTSRTRTQARESLAPSKRGSPAPSEASSPAQVSQEELDAAQSQLKDAEQRISELESKVTDLEQDIVARDEVNTGLKTQVTAHETRISELETTCDGLQKLKIQHEAKIQELEADIMEHQRTERDLRNTILELKGNIRVFARVRPLASAEDNSVFEFPQDDPEQRSLTVVGQPRKSVDGRSSTPQRWDFQFDRVFHPHHNQADVFDEVSHLIRSALDGYRVCIFAYGQTGSGKTFTMQGGEQEQSQTRGIIPRSVDLIFSTISSEQRHQAWEYELSASFLEIYNESIRDLCADPQQQQPQDPTPTYEIRHVGSETTVHGLRQIAVQAPEEIHEIIDQANKVRATGATNCNERSSRSHSVFTLMVTATHKATNEKRRGVLNLVDLAGSERLAQSQAKGQVLKETQAINKSLSCLGDVIFALASRKSHIPYRNSKLTHLLQNSLGGNCKTLMLVNLAPANAPEGLCSLRFGHKVNSCDIGTAKVQTSSAPPSSSAKPAPRK